MIEKERELKSAGRPAGDDDCGARPDRVGDSGATGEETRDRRKLRGRRDHSPGAPVTPDADNDIHEKKERTRPERKRGKASPLTDLKSLPEFRADMKRVAELIEQERGSGLEVGRIAHRWIGDRKYNRFLNANRFASLFQQITGTSVDARTIRVYVEAYVVFERVEQAGISTSHLGVSHFAQIARSRCRSPEEQVELARRAEKRKATGPQIRSMGQRLHAEVRQKQRTIEVAVTEAKVRVMDGLDLIKEQADGAIECCIVDCQWSDSASGENHDYPEVYTPDKPVDHVCQCLESLGDKLSPMGLIFLFYSACGFLDRRIAETCERVGLKHAATLIWQGTTGGFQNPQPCVRIAHEQVLIFCHKGYAPEALNGGVNSVTPKWPAPTTVSSGKQPEAVHRHQKPLQLMELLISIATVNGLVVDPFAGSGTAGIAAIRRGCPYVGAELMPDIAEIANRRIAFGQDDCDEVVENINFFLDRATPEQFQAITTSLEKNGLACVRKVIAAGRDTAASRNETKNH